MQETSQMLSTLIIATIVVQAIP
ncbi:putative membrane protein, partial [Chlamydia psittaci 06-1683]